MLKKITKLFKRAKNFIANKVDRRIVKWYAGLAICISGLEIAYLNGTLKEIYENDPTKISVGIFLILIWQTFKAGFVLFERNRTGFKANKDAFKKDIESGWFWSDSVLSLGMVGTVIGFMSMLAGFITLDIADPESVQGIIAQLGSGMATALTTTLVGLIASILIKVQFFMLDNMD